MPCYNPTRVLMDGDHRIQFARDWRWASYLNGETTANLPCRNCIGCNMATQREWSVRCFHEAQLHAADWQDPETQITTQIPNSSVITLTYNDEHLPESGLLQHDDFQRFMKRLKQRRKQRKDLRPIRSFMCGEYGGKTSRPHYHAIIFGETFDDRYLAASLDGQHNEMSYELDSLWSQRAPGATETSNIGRATVDTFTFAGAAYVAGYVAKKAITEGKHLGPFKTVRTRIDPGENPRWKTQFIPIAPEYRRMTPGLGRDWILKWSNLERVYSQDCVKISEWTFHPPKYYDKLVEERRPDLMADIRLNRRDGMSKAAEEWTPARCAAAEQIQLDALQQRRDSL